MIEWEKSTKDIQVAKFITCDRCKRRYSYEDDMLDIQEFHKIRFIAGYASAFDDGDKVACDLCSKCLRKLIWDYCRIVNEER